MEYERREEVYGRDEYYWGTEPSNLAQKTVEYLHEDSAGAGGTEGMRVVDIGAGEGRDSVFFAEHGFDVYAVDVSPAGLEKANRLADERGVEITTIEADANTFEFPNPMDVVFSVGVVQFIRPGVRPRQFERFQEATRSGGVHSIFAFVDHPDVPPAPDTTDDQYLFDRDELQGYYEGWETLHSEELIFEDDSGGIPHEHAARIHVAAKGKR